MGETGDISDNGRCSGCGKPLSPIAMVCKNCEDELEEGEAELTGLVTALPSFLGVCPIVAGLFLIPFSLLGAVCFIATGGLFFDRVQEGIRHLGIRSVPIAVPVLLMIIPIVLFFLIPILTMVRIGHATSKRFTDDSLRQSLEEGSLPGYRQKKRMWSRIKTFVRKQIKESRRVYVSGYKRIRIDKSGSGEWRIQNAYITGNTPLLGRRRIPFVCRLRVENGQILISDLTFWDWTVQLQNLFFFPTRPSRKNR